MELSKILQVSERFKIAGFKTDIIPKQEPGDKVVAFFALDISVVCVFLKIPKKP